MSQSRIEWKVGGFITVGLILTVVLILNFSKGVSLFKPTYIVRLKTTNVGGIKLNASVLLAGVSIGSVQQVELAPDGKSVIIFLQVDRRHDIPGDAAFNIEAQGFLGDQFVSIAPTANALPALPKDGTGQRECRAPFNIQDAARDALGLVQRLDQAAQKIDLAVDRVNRTVLAEETLTNLAVSVANFRAVSEQTRTVTERALALETKAIGTLDRLDALLANSTSPVQSAVSNVLHFSEQLTSVGADLQATVGSNRLSLQASVRNLEIASGQVTNLLSEVNAGRGVVGALLKDDVLAANFKQLSANLPGLSSQVGGAVSNLNAFTTDARLVVTNLNGFLGDGRLLAGNGSTLLSNLNAYGLFYKPKPPKPTNSPAVTPLLSPRQKSSGHY